MNQATPVLRKPVVQRWINSLNPLIKTLKTRTKRLTFDSVLKIQKTIVRIDRQGDKIKNVDEITCKEWSYTLLTAMSNADKHISELCELLEGILRDRSNFETAGAKARAQILEHLENIKARLEEL